MSYIIIYHPLYGFLLWQLPFFHKRPQAGFTIGKNQRPVNVWGILCKKPGDRCTVPGSHSGSGPGFPLMDFCNLISTVLHAEFTDEASAASAVTSGAPQRTAAAAKRASYTVIWCRHARSYAGTTRSREGIISQVSDMNAMQRESDNRIAAGSCFAWTARFHATFATSA